MLLDSFRDIVEGFGCQPVTAAQAYVFQGWIRTISLDDITEALSAYGQQDLRSLVRRLTPNPPSVLDLLDVRGYVLQVLYWYPLEDRSVYGSYDTEDIHSHFGFIVTRALIGNPYVATHFRLGQDQRVQMVGESLFQEGADSIIAPEDIHSVRCSSGRPALSVRIAFPPNRAEMQVYDKDAGTVREVIVSSTERRTIELAGLLATLDARRFEQSVKDLQKDCLLPKSIGELARLTALGGRNVKPE